MKVSTQVLIIRNPIIYRTFLRPTKVHYSSSSIRPTVSLVRKGEVCKSKGAASKAINAAISSANFLSEG